MPHSLPNHFGLHGDHFDTVRDPKKRTSGNIWRSLFSMGRSGRAAARNDATDRVHKDELIPAVQPCLSDARFVVNAKGNVLECTTSSARYLGIFQTEIMGSGLLSWIHVQDRLLFLTQLCDAAQTGRRVEFSLRVRRHTRADAMGSQTFNHVKARAVPMLSKSADARHMRLALVFWDNQCEVDLAKRGEALDAEWAYKTHQLSQAQIGFAEHIGSLLRMVDALSFKDDEAQRKKQSAQMTSYLARLQSSLLHQAEIEAGKYTLAARQTKAQILVDEAIVDAHQAHKLVHLDIDMDMNLVRWLKQRFSAPTAHFANIGRQGHFIYLDFDAGSGTNRPSDPGMPNRDFLKAESLAHQGGGRFVMHKKGDNTHFYRLHLPISAQNRAKLPAASPKKKGDEHLVTQWIGKPMTRKSAAG